MSDFGTEKKVTEITKHNECYFCKHRGTVFGSVHSSCKRKFIENNLKPPQGDSYGKRMGWYYFPINFDPVWKTEKCEGYEQK